MDAFNSEDLLEKPKTSKAKSRANNGRWTYEEHKKFVQAVLLFRNNWKKVQTFIGTRDATQSRSHAQKFFLRLRTKLNRNKTTTEDLLPKLKSMLQDESKLEEISKDQVLNFYRSFLTYEAKRSEKTAYLGEDEDEEESDDNSMAAKELSLQENLETFDALFKVEKVSKKNIGSISSLGNSVYGEAKQGDVYDAMKIHFNNKFKINNFKFSNCTGELSQVRSLENNSNKQMEMVESFFKNFENSSVAPGKLFC